MLKPYYPIMLRSIDRILGTIFALNENSMFIDITEVLSKKPLKVLYSEGTYCSEYTSENILMTDKEILEAFTTYYLNNSTILQDGGVVAYAIDHFDQCMVPCSVRSKIKRFIHPDTIKKFLIVNGQATPDEVEFNMGFDFDVNHNDTAVDPVLWDFGIAGMIQFLLPDDMTPLFGSDIKDTIVEKLLSMTVELPKDIFEKSYSEKIPDPVIIQEDGEKILLLCALLSDNSVAKDAQCTAYIIKQLELDKDGKPLKEALDKLNCLFSMIDTDEFPTILSNWMCTNRIPIEIRKLASITLKVMINRNSKNIRLNQHIYQIIDGHTTSPYNSVVHLVDEFNSKEILQIDTKYQKIISEIQRNYKLVDDIHILEDC